MWESKGGNGLKLAMRNFIFILLWYNNFIKLPSVLVESNLNQRCKITSMYVFKTKLFTHARFRNAQALSSAKETYTNKKQRRLIRNFFNIRLTNKYMHVDETYVILIQYLHCSQLLQNLKVIILCSGFDFLKIDLRTWT